MFFAFRVDARLQLSDGLGDCGAAGSTEDLLDGVSHGVVGGVHAASCVAFGGAHEVVERVVWLKCGVVLCTAGHGDLALVGELEVGHGEAELLPDSHLTEDGPDLEGWLEWTYSAPGQCVLALEGVHGRRDLVGGLRVQGVEVAGVNLVG